MKLEVTLKVNLATSSYTLTVHKNSQLVGSYNTSLISLESDGGCIEFNNDK